MIGLALLSLWVNILKVASQHLYENFPYDSLIFRMVMFYFDLVVNFRQNAGIHGRIPRYRCWQSQEGSFSGWRPGQHHLIAPEAGWRRPTSNYAHLLLSFVTPHNSPIHDECQTQ